MITSSTGDLKILFVGPPGWGKSTLLGTLPWYGTKEEMEEYNALETYGEKLEYTGKYILVFLMDTQGEHAYAHALDRMRVIKVTTGDEIKIPIIHKKPPNQDFQGQYHQHNKHQDVPSLMSTSPCRYHQAQLLR